MAMFPNATKGLMPFVPSKTNAQNKHKRCKPHVNGGKLNNNHKSENRHVGGMTKMYQVTLKDKKGYTYKYIVKSDGTKSLPELAEQKINLMAAHSMPNIVYTSPEKQRKILADKVEALNSLNGENFSTSLDLRECGKKEGLFSTFLRFIKEKTGKGEKEKSSKTSSKSHKSKSGKSKRKPRDLSQRKRQRTVSAMSNLDPIQESPNEHEFEDDEDETDSYTHDETASSSDSDASSVASSISCTLEVVAAS